MVEANGQLAGELEVLGLVLADGHVGGVVEGDVGGLQDRVGEEAELELVFGRGEGRGGVGQVQLALPLRHAAEVAHGGAAAEDPHELGVLLDAALGEDGAARRVEADGKQAGQHLAATLPQVAGVLLDGDGVQVDDGEEQGCVGRGLILQADPLSQGAQVVAQVGDAGGLDAGEDDGGGESAGGGRCGRGEAAGGGEGVGGAGGAGGAGGGEGAAGIPRCRG